MDSTAKADVQFQDLDSKDGFESCFIKLSDSLVSNFVVDFSTSTARCATKLDNSDFTALLAKGRDPSLPTRWINFWGGHAQRGAIKQVAHRYGISPRLVHLLCLAPSSPSSQTNAKEGSASDGESSDNPDGHDVEKNDASCLSRSRIAPPAKVAPKQDASFGNVVEGLWHFCSIDWGDGYIHLGLNLLFSVPGVDIDNGHSKPKGLRVWMSLILCNDGTVISIYQVPEQSISPHPNIMKVVRMNVRNIFRQLSNLHKGEDDSLMTVTIRNCAQATTSTPGKANEPASLLLYYLLDDWVTTFGLVTRKDHPYRTELEEIRAHMFHTPDIQVIERLHSIGRQLQVLKLMYQSYELIVNRILQRQRTMKEEARWHHKNHLGIRRESDGTDDDDENLNLDVSADSGLTSNTSIGVRLHMSAIVRFERLLDRIRLLPLTEIEECLNEKESLAMMSFNLVTLKESQAIEKLTRITILLAKATILFLPVSLMTGYFSVQIQDLQGVYTVKTYWLCFLVIVVLSVAGLFFFGLISDRLEGRVVYKSLTRTMWEKASSGGRKRKVG